MKSLFVNNDSHPLYLQVIGIAASILTLGLFFFLAYEWTFEPAYWKNRWRLHRYLRRGEVRLLDRHRVPLSGVNITEYTIAIQGQRFMIWVYRGLSGTSEFTLSSGYDGEDYIGLFTGSLTCKWLKRSALQQIVALPLETAE